MRGRRKLGMFWFSEGLNHQQKKPKYHPSKIQRATHRSVERFEDFFLLVNIARHQRLFDHAKVIIRFHYLPVQLFPCSVGQVLIHMKALLNSSYIFTSDQASPCDPLPTFTSELSLLSFLKKKNTRNVSEVSVAFNVHRVSHTFLRFLLSSSGGGRLVRRRGALLRALFRHSCWQENDVCFSRLLRELRLDCTVKNGPGVFIGPLSFHLQTNFLRENCSVFASLTLDTSKTTCPPKLKDLDSFFFSALRSCNCDVSAPTWLPRSDLCSRFTQLPLWGNLAHFSFEDLHNSTSVILLFS